MLLLKTGMLLEADGGHNAPRPSAIRWKKRQVIYSSKMYTCADGFAVSWLCVFAMIGILSSSSG
jgi:hypothetical protein